MNFNINRVTLLGRVGQVYDVKEASKSKIVRFSVATNSSVKRGDEWVNETTWHNVTWFAPANFGDKNIPTKGMQVFVDGELAVDEYEQDGVKRKSVYVKVGFNGSVIVHGGGELDYGQSNSNAVSASNKKTVKAAPKPAVKNKADDVEQVADVDFDDDIPF